jgi:hypothetical protein
MIFSYAGLRSKMQKNTGLQRLLYNTQISDCKRVTRVSKAVDTDVAVFYRVNRLVQTWPTARMSFRASPIFRTHTTGAP